MFNTVLLIMIALMVPDKKCIRAQQGNQKTLDASEFHASREMSLSKEACSNVLTFKKPIKVGQNDDNYVENESLKSIPSSEVILDQLNNRDKVLVPQNSKASHQASSSKEARSDVPTFKQRM